MTGLPERVSLDLAQGTALDLQVILADAVTVYAREERLGNHPVKWNAYKVKALGLCNMVRAGLNLQPLTLDELLTNKGTRLGK